MNALKRLWIKITQFAEMLEDIDGPKGDYFLSLGTRIDKLERDLEHLESALLSGPGGGRTRLAS